MELPKGAKIVVDEIQKLPILLDEVHSIMFDKPGFQFCVDRILGSQIEKERGQFACGASGAANGHGSRFQRIGGSRGRVSSKRKIPRAPHRFAIHHSDELNSMRQRPLSEPTTKNSPNANLARDKKVFFGDGPLFGTINAASNAAPPALSLSHLMTSPCLSQDKIFVQHPWLNSRGSL